LPYLPLLMSVAVFTMVYYAVPNVHVSLLHALIGGLLTALLFDVAKSGFAWSMSRLSFEPIYGSFAAVPLFLIWLHLVWVLILAGAVFVYGLSLVRMEGEGAREPLLVKAVRVLRLLYDAHQDGRTVSEAELSEQVPLERAEKLRLFEVFSEFRLLAHTADEGWALGRSLKALTLWDLYQRLPEGLEESRLEPIGDMADVIEPLRNIARFGSNEMSVSLDSMFAGLR
jgi:membrane protein